MKKLLRFLAAAAAFFILGTLAAAAPASPPRDSVIRVGTVDIDNFLVMDQKGDASGYAAEYLSAIAEYTGWRYEYIQAPWSDCLDMLKEGRLDLLLPAEYSQKRAADFLFSDVECCMDYAALVGLKSNKALYYEDFAHFQDMAVGLIEDNYLNELFDQYALGNGFSVRKRYYPTSTALNDALFAGEVEAIVNGNMNFRTDQKLLAKVDFMPAYFITSKANTALMDELDGALHKIKLQNPYYTASLHNKYYGKIERLSVGFTREEAAFIGNCPPLTVLVQADGYPLEWADKSGRDCLGILPDIARLIARESGLQFAFTPVARGKHTGTAIENGEGDLYLSAGDIPDAGRDSRITYTKEYCEIGVSMLRRRDAAVSPGMSPRVALDADQPAAEAILRKTFAGWEALPCESLSDCLKAVDRGQADVALVNTIALRAGEYEKSYSNLVEIYMGPETFPLRIGIAPGADPMLKQILNKAIYKLEEKDIQQCILNNSMARHSRVTLSYLIRVYPAQVFAVTGVVMVLILGAVFLLYRYFAQRKQNRVLAEKNRLLEEAARIQSQLRLEMELDDLTGLKNKKTCKLLCAGSIDRWQDSALFIMDVDDFKSINDQHGHLFGDRVLQGIGGILNGICGDRGVVGRIGGDEFFGFLEGPGGRHGARDLAAQIHTALSAMDTGMAGVLVTCSIGIAFWDPAANTYEKYFAKADEALYRAKKQGKNHSSF